MNLTIDYLDKFKFTTLAGWLITLLIAIVGFNFIKEIVAFVLTKLYEFFIQHTYLR